ncbi:hypothetical protein TorRG33x02_210360 [Trema orientale]|uniref:Uncharacterized protein n=1 Tax=Trema orientale TaxID=63057 RepID=A0A2P5ECD6_TREOI|nr:hypothetical protein TorRG33x02_210360 [Trema orientale]
MSSFRFSSTGTYLVKCNVMNYSSQNLIRIKHVEMQKAEQVVLKLGKSLPLREQRTVWAVRDVNPSVQWISRVFQVHMLIFATILLLLFPTSVDCLSF